MPANDNHRGPRELLWPVALALAAAAIYVLLVRRHDAPVIYPDEIYYGQLAHSLAGGAGYTWRGASIGINSLYPYVAAPAWMVGGADGGYVLAKTLGVLLACSTALPAYLIARSVVVGRPRAARSWALAAAALTLAGSWMVMADRTMSEVLAWPITTWSLACMVLALGSRRRPRLVYGALTLALAAAATRFQLVLLLGVVPLALGLDWFRQERSSRRVWWVELRGPTLASVALPVCVGLAAVVAPGAVLASYETAAGDVPPVTLAAWWTVVNLVETALMTGIVPLVALLAMSCSRANWRDERVGPLLAVALPALLVECAVAGWFLAAGTERPIDRYLIYSLPLLFAALVAAPGRVRPFWGIIWALAVCAQIVAMPMRGGSVGEAQGLFGALTRFTGWHGIDITMSTARQLLPLAMLAAFVGATGALLLATRRRGPFAAAATLLVVVWLAALGSWAWQRAGEDAATGRGLLPAQRDWIDRELQRAGAGGETGILYTSPGQPEIPLANEFFSKRIDKAWVLPPYYGNDVTPWGPVCNVQGIGSRGSRPVHGGIGRAFSPGTMVEERSPRMGDRCPRAEGVVRSFSNPGPLTARNLLVTGRDAQVTFRDAEVLAEHRQLALQLVHSRGNQAPHLLARVRDKCWQQPMCARLAEVETWTRRPASLRVAVSSGATDAVLRVGHRALRLRRGAKGVVSVPVGAGFARVRVLETGRVTEASRRTVEGVWLTEGGVTRRIYRALPLRQRPG